MVVDFIGVLLVELESIQNFQRMFGRGKSEIWEKKFTFWLKKAVWLSEFADREDKQLGKMWKMQRREEGGSRNNTSEGRSDCEGAKNGEFKNFRGEVYVFGKRIKKYVIILSQRFEMKKLES